MLQRCMENFFEKGLWKRRAIFRACVVECDGEGRLCSPAVSCCPVSTPRDAFLPNVPQFTNYTYQISRENLISSSVLCLQCVKVRAFIGKGDNTLLSYLLNCVFGNLVAMLCFVSYIPVIFHLFCF